MKLFVVSLGPGAGKNLTFRAKEVLDQCEVIVGYKNTVGLIEVDYMNKTLIKNDIGKDVDTCHTGLEKALEGAVTAIVVAGDSSVYDTSSLLLKLSSEYPDVEIEMIPGISPAIAGASLLGSPISDDFVVFSLSDKEVPWEVIERRLMCAVEGGFVICLSSPVAPGRMESLRKACRILLWKRKPETICGYVKGAGTWGEKVCVLTLEELFQCDDIDMTTTVFIGNDQTKNHNGKMHTPRGFSPVEMLALNM